MSQKGGGGEGAAGVTREARVRAPGGTEDARVRACTMSSGRSSPAAAAPELDPEPRRRTTGESGCMGSGEGVGRRRGEPKAEGNGCVGRGEAGAVGDGGGVGGRTVGDGRGMVHSLRRWPDLPQPLQQRGSRQSATLWCLSRARQRKQQPAEERVGEHFAGECFFGSSWGE
jgi:hypothetical protein